MKRLAIHLYGHVRTYERTYENFYKNIIDINKKDGWEIDIFIHTWDVFNVTDHNVWHAKDNLFPTMSNKKLSQNDKDKVISIYQPKKYIIEQDLNKPAGRYHSIHKAMELRAAYEKEKNIKYDLFLTTRMDLLFLKALRVDEYLNLYKTQGNLKNIQMSKKINFCSCWHYRFPLNLPIIDPRFPNESDLLWFGNYCSNKGFDPLIAFLEDKEIVNTFIKYRFNMEFIQIREVTKNIDFVELVPYSQITAYKQELKIKNTLLDEKDCLINKLIFIEKYNSAKARIQSHLSYKLGTALIANSKSLLGYIKMPYILMAISIAHKEQNKNLKLAKDKLPPLESYPDYNEALKEKECFTYKLGKAFIKAHKNWYGGGYIKFLLKDVPRLKREFRENKGEK